MIVEKSPNPILCLANQEQKQEQNLDICRVIEKSLLENRQLCSSCFPGSNREEQVRNGFERVYKNYQDSIPGIFHNLLGDGKIDEVRKLVRDRLGTETRDQRSLREARRCGWKGKNPINARNFLISFLQDIQDLASSKFIPRHLLVFKDDVLLFREIKLFDNLDQLDLPETLNAIHRFSLPPSSIERIKCFAFEAIIEEDFSRLRRACLLIGFRIKGKHQQSILMAAVKNKKTNIAKLIISNYPEFWIKGSFFEKETNEIVKSAIRNELFDVAEELAKLDIEINPEFADLHCVVSKSSLETPHLISRLLAGIPNFNRRDENGQTLIAIAVSRGNWSICKLLIAAGANLEERDSEGNTLLMKGLPHLEIVSHLTFLTKDLEKTNNKGETVFQLAATTASPEVIQQLIGAGVDTNVRFSDGDHVLHKVIAAENISNLGYLVKNTDIDARSKLGVTPLIACAEKSWKSADLVVKATTFILDAGADTALVNASGHTAYQIAQDKGHLAAAQVIAQWVEKQKII